MFETLDKLMLAGLGAMSMTKERAEQIFDEYVEKGRATRDQKPGFVRDLLDQAERARRDMEKMIAEQVRKAIDQTNLATKDDVICLSEKLDQISLQVSAMNLTKKTE
jgi:polyhydroxyalkanoate synthesis regulator phasin